MWLIRGTGQLFGVAQGTRREGKRTMIGGVPR